MILNLQNMWTALQVILDYLCLLPNFWPQKSKNFENKNKNTCTWIYHHFTPASQKSQSFDV